MEFDINTCSGCMACMNVCPKDAITVTQSVEGFILPYIDEDKCVHCGLCEAVCDFRNETHIGDDMRRAFSMAHSNKKVVKHSSSGGAFTALSDSVLSKKGVVFGATYDADFNVIHTRAVNSTERDKMRGSKYVQCDPGLSYRDIRKQLEESKLVLFVGTPCQCAGLKSYLKKDYDNLIVVDFLCHGVPSNKMFKEHIALVSKDCKGKPIDYTFRTKKYGWNGYANVVTFAEHSAKTKEVSLWLAQAFFTFFSVNLSLRPSCFSCPYRNPHRPSDITIGDFWQIENLTGKKNKEGVSFMTANTNKGEALIKEIASSVQLKEYSMAQVQFCLPKDSTKKPKRYDAFWETYRNCGYKKVVEKYFDNSFKARARWSLKKTAKRLKIV